jgi:hypothetical protein
MTEDGITLSGEQLQAIYRALAAMEREVKLVKLMTDAKGWQRTYIIFTNLQAIRGALTPNLFRSAN